MIALELARGAAFLLALCILESFIQRALGHLSGVRQVASGLLFGAICVVGMVTPLTAAPGVIFDARTAVLACAGLFGGPWVAGLAGAMALITRLILGGQGAIVGCGVIVFCVGAGLLYRNLYLRTRVQLNAVQLLWFGLALHTVLGFGIYLEVPPEVSRGTIITLAAGCIVVYSVTTMLLGLMLKDVSLRLQTESALKATSERLQASELRFRNLLQNIPSMAVQGFDAQGITTYWNDTSEQLYGYSAKEAIGTSQIDLLVPKAMRSRAREVVAEMVESGRGMDSTEIVLQHKNGSDVLVFSTHAVVDNSNGLREIFRFDLDLSERMRAESELRVAAIAFETQEGMMVTDANRIILRVNRAFTEITGYSAQEVVGQTPSLLDSGWHDASFFIAMRRTLEKDGKWDGEIWNRRKSGEVFPERLHITAVTDSRGRVVNYVGSFTDITHRKAAEDQIRQLAFYDPLTNLPNRRLLMDRLQHALVTSARSGLHGALLFIDLDHFKTLNDTMGHDIGDLLLQQVGQRLTECVRAEDTVARLGGDEFVVMLENLGHTNVEAAAKATQIGDKVVKTLNAAYHLTGVEFHSTPSMGVTLFNGHDTRIDDLLKQADLAMYQAKSAGRNGMRFFDPQMQASVSQRAAMESDIRQGILLGQFLLHYQPQVDSLGRVIGAEALLRWKHPARGMVSPAQFIPVAEESGHILALGNWVLETACAQLVQWAKLPELQALTLAVNVSARQFRQPDFADYILGLLDYTGANPLRLKLELTESLLADNLDDVIQKMEALRARGVGFSLDDFGTGYSSLTYLKRLPLDQLKIDQSFVSDVLVDANDASIARTIVALGQGLGLAVIAEGVETPEQRAFLLEAGCTTYQGYLFSRPLAADQFQDYVMRSIAAV